MKTEIIVGRLFARKTREFLERCKSEGRTIEFTEESRLFEKKFIITGSQIDLNYVMTAIKNPHCL